MAEVVGFYGVEGTYGCFSNFYEVPFTFEGEQFKFSEAMIMWQKARLFKDTTMMKEILKAPVPREAKRLGRRVSPYDDRMWEANRGELVVPGLYAKFEQNPEIRRVLLGTGDALIAECAPRDRIWGIGMPTWNPDIYNPNCWKGTNLLGTYLMEVRSQLREAGYTA